MNDADIVKWLLLREGGSTYTNNPADRGGPTKYGVTLGALRQRRPNAAAADVVALTESEAVDILVQDYIVKPGFNIILDGWLRWAVVDAAVNHGPRAAKKLVQRALGVKDDGDWGPLTRQALFQANQRKLAVRVCTMRQRLYAAIVASNLADEDRDGIPDNVEFIKGWTDRNMDIIEELVA